MKKKGFKNLLSEICEEVFGYEITKYEKKYFWPIYKDLYQTFENDSDTAYELAEMVHYDKKQMRNFRDAQAEIGIELTPRQACIYIMTIECALLEVGYYTWEDDDIIYN